MIHGEGLRDFGVGPYVEKVRELLELGYDPLTVEDIISTRTRVLEMAPGDERNRLLRLWGGSYLTGDAVAHLDDRIKVIRGPDLMRQLDAIEYKLITRGYYLIMRSTCDRLHGPEYTGGPSPEDEDFVFDDSSIVMRIWTELVGHPEAVLHYRTLLERCDYQCNMRLLFAPVGSRDDDWVAVRPWKLDELWHGSDLDGRYPCDTVWEEHPHIVGKKRLVSDPWT